jgi:hypothetical protein
MTTFVGAIVAIVFFFWGRGTDYTVEMTVPSPDGSRVATLYTGKGGGAAGWCSQVISVNTDMDPFSIEREEKSTLYQVFRSDCEAKVAFRWLSTSSLHIEFSKGEQTGGASVYMSPSDNSGRVKVEYSFGA